MKKLQVAAIALFVATISVPAPFVRTSPAVLAISKHSMTTRGSLSGRLDAPRPTDFRQYNANAVVRSTEVQKMGMSGRGVTIAVIDSGIDAFHPDLKGVVIDEACFCTKPDGTPCCPNGESRQFGRGAAVDEIGHGTHMAGIIAGRGRTAPTGMAPGARIVSIKVTGAEDDPSIAAMIEALEWIADSRPEVRVVNMSLGTRVTYAGACDSASADTRSFAAIGQRLLDRGTILVAAAGNSWTADRMTAPACVSSFLAVGAVHSMVSVATNSSSCPPATIGTDRVACFSNGSSSLAVLAPGVDIASLYPGGRIAIGSGTSQATAAVSGTIALLLDGAPGSERRIVSALHASGVPITDERSGRVTPRIDARAALMALRAPTA